MKMDSSNLTTAFYLHLKAFSVDAYICSLKKTIETTKGTQ